MKQGKKMRKIIALFKKTSSWKSLETFFEDRKIDSLQEI